MSILNVPAAHASDRYSISFRSMNLTFAGPLTSDSAPPFRLNAFEQFRVIPIKLVREFHGVFQRVGIDLKTFPQFAGSRIIKEEIS